MRASAGRVVAAAALALLTFIPASTAAPVPADRWQRGHDPSVRRFPTAAPHAAVDRTRVERERRTHLRRDVKWHRDLTWRWQDAALVARTPSSYGERRAVSSAYLEWMVRLWNERRIEAKHQAARVARRWEAMNRDFETAVRLLAKQLGVESVAGWVLSCADSEGGRGVWVYRGHGLLDPATIYRDGSGNLVTGRNVPGGWMQFFPSTLYNNIGPAYDFAQGRGVRVPAEYRSWFSPVGQALTALWMFHHEGSGQWTGAGC